MCDVFKKSPQNSDYPDCAHQFFGGVGGAIEAYEQLHIVKVFVTVDFFNIFQNFAACAN